MEHASCLRLTWIGLIVLLRCAAVLIGFQLCGSRRDEPSASRSWKGKEREASQDPATSLFETARCNCASE